MTDAVTGAAYGADDIADLLGRPRPTPEQRAVIEAPAGPALVVAGAGSGKTETMANRVVWLVANRLVDASQVLGLTFTRKAAAELGERIRVRLAGLDEARVLPERDGFEVPTVATYNSFANSVYREHAALLGREGDAAVLSPASAWRLARSTVLRSDDERLPTLGKSVDALTRALVELHGVLAEHVADPHEARAVSGRFADHVRALPNGGRGAYADAIGHADAVAALPVLLGLVEDYRAEKARRGLVEYSDQVAFALQVVERFPSAAAEVRERSRVVLLDEYQDTSIVQSRLLATLFSGTSVMAVGDPHQSIYGWRGASAGNLEQFGPQFAGESGARQFTLSTSWRNGTAILHAANTLAEPLTRHSRVPVATLVAGPAATALPVTQTIGETVVEEADAVARWFAAGLAAKPGSTSALLLRTRKTLPFFLDALREHAVPFHVLGVGGLLAQPEVADIVCALAVLADGTADSELVRLLAGSRWRIGAADLDGLRRIASWLGTRDSGYRPLSAEVVARMRDAIDGAPVTLVDALDFVQSAPEGHGVVQRHLSAAGERRLREAGGVLRRLRARAGLDLVDLIALVQQELLLDIELGANDLHVTGADTVDALLDAVDDYLSAGDLGGVAGFLSWLREAERRDDLMPRPEDPAPGAVQVLTVHAAKGLEWDRVAVARLVDDELPARPLDGTAGWLRFGVLPYELRGDARELPVLPWRSATTRKELLDAVAEFRVEVLEHLHREERRLAYVAVTRARHELLLSGSFWATQKSPRRPSVYLHELAAAGAVPPPPEASTHDENPLAAIDTTFTWPLDPLGGRRERVEEAAALVRAAEPGDAGAWQEELDLLLEERRLRLAGPPAVRLPDRIAASRVEGFVTDPEGTADALRRPVPVRPYRASRLGTLFHGWVEQHYRDAGTAELVDDALEPDTGSWPLDDAVGAQEGGGDAGGSGAGGGADADEERVRRWQATFAASRFATRVPVDVEREVHIRLAGRTVVCKIDAVFERDGRYELVDWKTGTLPRGADDLERRSLQLALYRTAYARWRGVDPADVDALFYFVDDDLEVRPDRIIGEDELEVLLLGAAGPA